MLPLLEARLCTKQQRDMVWRTLQAMPLRLLERVLPWLAGAGQTPSDAIAMPGAATCMQVVVKPLKVRAIAALASGAGGCARALSCRSRAAGMVPSPLGACTVCLVIPR